MSTIIALHHKRGKNCMRGYTCQERWIQCSTHPLSVLCPCGYCRYYHCTWRQSVDACSHPIVVRGEAPVSSSTVSKYMWGEEVNSRHCTAKMKNVCSKEKPTSLISPEANILSFVLTFLLCDSHSVNISVYIETILRAVAFYPVST